MKTQEENVLTPVAVNELEPSFNPYLGAVAAAVKQGLSDPTKWLPAWLFYDAEGSQLFEQITTLPEYYLTTTERSIFQGNADAIIIAARKIYERAVADADGKKLRLLELGAGSASKTGILLAAAVRRQGATQYLPVDVSATAMEEAIRSLAIAVDGLDVRPQIANYVTDTLRVPTHNGPSLALYIGSSIGNFAPEEAVAILRNLRAQLRVGDSLLLGTDLVKDLRTLLAAYNDASEVTAAFNLNLLRRFNRELGANFDLSRFRHKAIWNESQSRIEMHLESTQIQTVYIPALDLRVRFDAGETIHTENSYKFTQQSVQALLEAAGFAVAETWQDARRWFAVTLAEVRA